ncbi:MAG: fibronectin type III domain-containing protein, partial [Usitatibacteraceae bacterium]
ATLNVTPPANSGGSAITSYTATCGAISATGPASPITVTGLTNGASVACTVTATGPGGTSLPSNSVNVTPTAIAAPGAPTIGMAIPGNTQATIAFTPPASDGGSAISTYTATCNPGNLTGSSSVSPITVPNLVNGTTYACSVTATNSIGPGAASATVNVTPGTTLSLVGVVSRKTHGATGDYDVVVNANLAITEPVTTEPRAIGAGHTLVFQFSGPVTVAGSVAAVDASAVPIGAVSAVAVGNDVVVTLTGIPDNKRLTVLLTNVNAIGLDASASIGFLVGDVNGTASVNSSDISGVKARSGQTTTSLNFKFDVNASGAVNSSDISAVKARSGLTLP